jgi:hypothetical protein
VAAKEETANNAQPRIHHEAAKAKLKAPNVQPRHALRPSRTCRNCAKTTSKVNATKVTPASTTTMVLVISTQRAVANAAPTVSFNMEQFPQQPPSSPLRPPPKRPLRRLQTKTMLEVLAERWIITRKRRLATRLIRRQ